jgi:hypothetical protein
VLWFTDVVLFTLLSYPFGCVFVVRLNAVCCVPGCVLWFTDVVLFALLSYPFDCVFVVQPNDVCCVPGCVLWFTDVLLFSSLSCPFGCVFVALNDVCRVPGCVLCISMMCVRQGTCLQVHWHSHKLVLRLRCVAVCCTPAGMLAVFVALLEDVAYLEDETALRRVGQNILCC